MEPIEHVAAWLKRVARNRIIDRFRKASQRVSEPASIPTMPTLEPASEPSGRMARARRRWSGGRLRARDVPDQLAAALDELPAEQREVFVAHELDGRSFKELSAETGVGINTLLGRKHAAVRHLRERLQHISTEFDH